MDIPERTAPDASSQAVEKPTSGAAPKKRRRGFAAMDPQKQREIASKGGRASHEKGTGHQWSSETARAAGRKGGLASHGRRSESPAGEPTGG
ncbi:MAG: KGG domain-containing protein [Polyangiales bacterium]